jgi:hypothetical protein
VLQKPFLLSIDSPQIENKDLSFDANYFAVNAQMKRGCLLKTQTPSLFL